MNADSFLMDPDNDGMNLLDKHKIGSILGLSNTDADSLDDLSALTVNESNSTAANDGSNDSDIFNFTKATPSVQEHVGIAIISITQAGGTFGTVIEDCISSDVAGQTTTGTITLQLAPY